MRLTDVEDLAAEHVDADERQVALRLLRLLDEPDDAAVVELGDAEHLRIGHVRQQDLRRRLLALELLDEAVDAAVEQVVAEVHHERVAVDERLADEHGVREPARRVLLDVGDARVPAGAVADGLANLRLRVADDDADVADAGSDERLEAVEEHRLVGDRDELLGARVGDRAEARPLPATQNQALHRPAAVLSAERAEGVRERADAGQREREVEAAVRRDVAQRRTVPAECSGSRP